MSLRYVQGIEFFMMSTSLKRKYFIAILLFGMIEFVLPCNTVFAASAPHPMPRPVRVPAPAPTVTPEQVEASLKKGVEILKKQLKGMRFNGAGNTGYLTLCVMALINSGVSAEDPAVAEAIKHIVKNAKFSTMENYQGVYNAGLINMLLGMLKDPKYKSDAESMAIRLKGYQSSDGGWGDFSRTQFALLGLKAASDLGVTVDPKVFTSAQNHLISNQHADGGWGYSHKAGTSYGSMTAAGITGMFIVNEQAAKNSKVCGANPSSPALQKGLDWLGENFTVMGNPKGSSWHYYYLYALERIGALTGQKFIGGKDWYREGAAFLITQQIANGQWNGNEPLATEFALLFLGKGNTPVVLQKLQYGEDWNPDPYDVKDLVAQASSDLKTPMTTQVVDTTVTLTDLAQAPVLYLQGRKTFEFSPTLREAIRGFVENGGFIIASACCGGEGFDRSFRAEMKILYPDALFEPLPEDHDIYSLKHKIVEKKAFMLEGLNTGCRTAIFYAPHDICCAWSGCRGCLDKLGVNSEDAKKLGVNLLAYAVGFQKLHKKLESVDAAGVKKETPGAKRNALIIGQLYHSGDWNPDPASLANLTQTLQSQTGMKGDVGKRMASIGSDDLGDYALLYLTGHRKFQYTATQIQELRAYLDRGGFLLADPCCGKPDFDAAFRKLCEDLYPQKKLTRLNLDHVIFQEPYAIKNVTYKPTVKALFPTVGSEPFLEGITAPDGRLQIVYSRFNFGCELHGHSCANCIGLKSEDAYKIAVNSVLYALSH
jgi:hypothetical protein